MAARTKVLAPRAGWFAPVVGLDLSLNGTAGIELEPHPYTSREEMLRGWTDRVSVRRGLFFVENPTQLKRWTAFLDPAAWTVRLAPGVERYDPVQEAARVRYVAGEVLRWVGASAARYVAIEDHAPNATGAHVYQLGWLHGQIRDGLYEGRTLPGVVRTEHERAVRLYDVGALKLMATGDPKADKPQMIVAADREGFDAAQFGKGAHENVADAYWCARLLLLERQIRAGRDPETVHPAPRKHLLTRVTKARPVPVTRQAYLTRVPRPGEEG